MRIDHCEANEWGVAGANAKIRTVNRNVTDKDRRDLTDEMRDKQRNVLWSETLVNSRAVDVFLWRGSTNPTLVQRIGAWPFCASFMAMGLGFLGLALHEGSWSWGPFAIGSLGVGSFAVGVKIFLNGWPKNKSRKHIQ